jgi:hypothetical protein
VTRTSQTSPSNPISIFIAGNADQAQEICRAFCFGVGLCVTVTPTEYIYTGGQETGVIVGLINYPRFPNDPANLLNIAKQLADDLMHGLHQHSYTIQTPTETYWHSRRLTDA